MEVSKQASGESKSSAAANAVSTILLNKVKSKINNMYQTLDSKLLHISKEFETKLQAHKAENKLQEEESRRRIMQM